jgi:hypothetical protein
MAGTPLSELATFKDVINQLDTSIREQLSSTNNAARADIALSYAFNNDGTITIKVTTVSKTISTTSQTLGTITVST